MENMGSEMPTGRTGSVRAYWDTLVRRQGLLIGVFAISVLLVFLAGLRERPLFRASATLLVNQDGITADPSYLLGQHSGAMNRRPNLANHIEMLKSYALAERVLQTVAARCSTADPSRLARQLSLISQADPAAALARWVSARPVRDADIVRLSIVAPDPDLCRTLCAAYIDAYQEMNLERSRTDISAVKSFVSSQLTVVGARLDSAEAALEAFKRANRLVDLPEETRALVERQTRILALYEQTRSERAGCEQELSWLAGMLAGSGGSLEVGIDKVALPVVSGLRAELSRLETEKAGLLIQGYADTSLRVRTIESRINALKPRLDREAAGLFTPSGAIDGTRMVQDAGSRIAELKSQLARLQATEAALKRTCDNYELSLNSLPAQERTLARLTRNLEVNRQVHALLAQRYEETRIQEAGRLATVTMVDAPRRGVQVRPNHLRNAILAVLLGLALSLAAVFAVDYFDTVVRQPVDLIRQGFAVLASIPTLNQNPQGNTAGVLSATQPDSTEAESFRVLRTSVQFAAADKPCRTLLVTSASPSEGKTTVAANLATVIAQSGRKTLLIDADLRKPRLHTLWRRHKKPGLTDTCILRLPLESVLHSDLVENLAGIFCGTTPPSPVDFLNSVQFASFLRETASKWDSVIIDAPPVLVSADAAVLASRVDAVILVGCIGRTDSRALAEASRLLKQTGARLLGVVANQVKPSTRYGYYRYHYYHYRYKPAASKATSD